MQQVLVRYFAAAPHGQVDHDTANRITWEHRELYRAVQDRDVERARSMIRVHFRSLVRAADRTELLEYGSFNNL
jgi:DNA-binding GntR family transcriptional regulator